MNKASRLKFGDIILIALLLLSAVLLFLLPLMSAKAESAEIVIAETGEVRIISLQANAKYEVSSRGVTLTVCVADGEVSVTQSSCRDGFCVNTPPISRSGQSIVCAPAGVVVRISGEGATVDAVS